jgi:hypothetical protein
MADSRTKQGRQWVTRTFRHIRARYPQISITIFLWKGGENFIESHFENSPSALDFDLYRYYFLLFNVDGVTHHIAFSKQQVDDCANPRSASAQEEIKRAIHDKFRSIVGT